MTLFGALHVATQKFYWMQAEKGNSRLFIQFLRQLHQTHPNKTLLLILDNGPIHKSKRIIKFLAEHDWVKLYFLPSYSPEYNPIELFWKWLKKFIHGTRAYASIAELLKKIRQVVWHYNEKWLLNTIKFQMKSYADLL
jgi:transposase